MLKSTKVLARREFDRGLAQSLGVVALFMLDETSGTMRDLMTGNSVGMGSQTITVGSDETGNVLKFDGGAASAQRLAFPLPVPSGASASGALPANTAGFTVLGRFKPTAAPAGTPGQFFGLAASANTGASIGIGVDTSLNVGLGWLSGSGAGIICTVAGSAGNLCTVYAASDGANGSAWINGRPSGSQGTGLSSGGAGLFDEIVFGAQHRSAGFLRQAKGSLEWGAVIYGVPMTDDLAKTLYASDFPYNLFKRRRSPWLVASAVGTVFSDSIALAASAGVSAASLQLISETADLAASAGAAAASLVTLAGSIALSASADASAAALARFGDDFAVSASSALSAAAGANVLDEAITVSAAAGVDAAGGLTIAGSIALGASAGAAASGAARFADTVAFVGSLTAAAASALSIDEATAILATAAASFAASSSADARLVRVVRLAGSRTLTVTLAGRRDGVIRLRGSLDQ